MSTKKTMKRKFDVNISYKEMLESYSIADLKDIASFWGLKGLSKYKKNDLLEYVYNHIITHFDEKFNMFNLNHLAIMSNLISGNNIFDKYPEESNELISIGLVLEGSISGVENVAIHKTVFDKFMMFYESNQEKLAFNSFIKDYMDLATTLYGVITKDEFVDMVYNFNEGVINKNIIESTVSYTAKYSINSEYENGFIYYYRLNEYKTVYEDIQTRSDLSYLKITQESFGDFVNNGSEVWTPSQRRLQEELEKNFNGDKEMTLDLVDELRIMLSYNHGVSDFISLFSKRHEVENMVKLKTFADIVISLNNDMNHWELKGSAPYMLSKIKKQETVIKGDKIGRNDPCPCGSGKKYKKCCINKDN